MLWISSQILIYTSDKSYQINALSNFLNNLATVYQELIFSILAI